MPTHDIIVIGASAGGPEALATLAAALPPDLPASLFVVIHMPASSKNVGAHVLNKAGALHAAVAKDGERIRHGVIYLSPSDRHLLIRRGCVEVSHGPKENLWRPAIDPLFRTAAVAYRSRVIGVVLGGYLDDGAAGLADVKRCGGIAVVQDPIDTPYPDMPRHAIAATRVDHIVPLAEMAALLAELTRQPARKPPPVPKDLLLEAGMTGLTIGGGMAKNKKLGHLAPITCPECGGPIWQIREGNLKRYRCEVGHAFTQNSIMAGQKDAVERALWGALLALEQRITFFEELVAGEPKKNGQFALRAYRRELAQAKANAQVLRDLLKR